MHDRKESWELAWLSAGAVQQYYRQREDERGPAQASELHALITEQASKDGGDLLRHAMAAFADGDTATQARADLEDALHRELERDEDFAAKLRIPAILFASLQGPWPGRPPRPADEGDGVATAMPSLVDAALWVAAAAGSGILGNAAYDAVKAAFRKRLRATKAAPPVRGAAYSPEQLTLIAQLAVQARCGELSIAVPRITELVRTDLVIEESRVVIELAANWVQAQVVVPADGFDSAQDISVTLYTPGDDWGNRIS